MYLHHTVSKKKGFTLIELMVSLTIFSIVMLISVGTLLSIIDVNAKAQALYSATTNLSFALDSMTREIRTGFHYYCKENSDGSDQETLPADDTYNDCEGGDFIAFSRERDESRVGYRLRDNRIEQKIESGNWIPITASDVVVETFMLTVKNSEPYYTNDSYVSGSDTDQPVVDVQIQGYVNNGLDTNTDFNIQTHIVERRLDII